MSDQNQDPTEHSPDSTEQPDGTEQPVGTENSDAPVPSDEELEEPSTEKDPGEQPAAEQPHEPEPSHHAVGIGVVGGPQTIADTPAAGEAAEITEDASSERDDSAEGGEGHEVGDQET